ncbi:MAG: PD-(D/E)XK nuclease family protein, partial [Lentisphaeria bacterium]|nr:PD-(D/E)XK nuclease family protein [Lentisphaeria bacterium]
MAGESLAQLRKQPHWSYSSINTFLNICSLQWAFRYVYRHESRFTSAALVFGGAFHRALEYVSRLGMDGQEVSPQTAATLFGDLLAQLARAAELEVIYPEGQTIDTLTQTGSRMIETYLATAADGGRIVSVSEAFRVDMMGSDGETLGKPLVGEIDCIVERDGRTVLVDWKTAARRWPKGKEHLDLQPTCYLYAFGRNNPSSDAHFRFDIATKTKTPTVERRLTTRRHDHFTRLIEQVRVME